MSVDFEIIVSDDHESEKPELRLWLRMLSTTKLVSQEIRRLRLGELSRRTMVTNGNVTGLVERLETEGLVKRETPGADRRVTVARLTDQGISVFSQMAKAHEGWLREMMADVDHDIIQTLLADLDPLKKSVRNHLSGAEDE